MVRGAAWQIRQDRPNVTGWPARRPRIAWRARPGPRRRRSAEFIEGIPISPKQHSRGARPGRHARLATESESIDEYAWGMAIDLNACIGCNACVVACQAENNIPVVGKEQVLHGREMHWIRIDRYYEGDADDPETYFQPVPCMHCENAPCELVCPVGGDGAQRRGAERDGLQPLRRHAVLLEQLPLQGPAVQLPAVHRLEDAERSKLLHNPDVTVRSRGVMEKCTYCVQRINAAQIDGRERGPAGPRRRNRDRLPGRPARAGDRLRRPQRPEQPVSQAARRSRGTTACWPN